MSHYFYLKQNWLAHWLEVLFVLLLHAVYVHDYLVVAFHCLRGNHHFKLIDSSGLALFELIDRSKHLFVCAHNAKHRDWARSGALEFIFEQHFLACKCLDGHHSVDLGFIGLNVKQKALNDLSWIYVHTVYSCSWDSLCFASYHKWECLRKLLFDVLENLHVSLLAIRWVYQRSVARKDFNSSLLRLAFFVGHVMDLDGVVVFLSSPDIEVYVIQRMNFNAAHAQEFGQIIVLKDVNIPSFYWSRKTIFNRCLQLNIVDGHDLDFVVWAPNFTQI